MANKVFANGREVSCKAGAGKSICAFPDVCFTPPQTPATPPGVPIPYPNTGMASDMTSGSKKVKVSGKEVMLKNKSYFKKSMGDEAGAAPKKGLITSTNRGKVYFIAWSMDVKFEGENVVRHLDMTTHNHGSDPPNSLMTAHIDEMSASQIEECKNVKEDAEKKCKGKTPDKCDKDCIEAQKCQLVAKKDDKKKCCKEGNTGDHLVEASSFFATGRGGGGAIPLKNCSGYNAEKAPCCCVSGGAYSGEHGRMSTLRGYGAHQCPEKDLPLSKSGSLKGHRATTYGAAKKRAAKALVLTFPQCKEECIITQFEQFDKESGLTNETEIKATTYGDPNKWAVTHKIEKALETLKKLINKTSSGGGLE